MTPLIHSTKPKAKIPSSCQTLLTFSKLPLRNSTLKILFNVPSPNLPKNYSKIPHRLVPSFKIPTPSLTSALALQGPHVATQSKVCPEKQKKNVLCTVHLKKVGKISVLLLWGAVERQKKQRSRGKWKHRGLHFNFCLGCAVIGLL